MLLPKNATVAVADGEKLSLFRNGGDETAPKLTPLPVPDVSSDSKGGAGQGHQSSSANPDDSQQAEDTFAAGTAALLNKHVLAGKISDLVIIAAPRSLGELRKHYHKKLEDVLLKEIAKDLTGHTSADIEKTILAA